MSQAKPHLSLKDHLVALAVPDLVVEVRRELQTPVYVPLKALCALVERERERETGVCS